jgi:2'-5' RNA ligase
MPPTARVAVVCAAFDDDADSVVRSRVAALAAAVDGVPAQLRHRPHITLAAARLPGPDLNPVEDVVRALAGGHGPFGVRLEHLGSFPHGGVLWMGPQPSAALAQLQLDTFTALTRADLDPAFDDHLHPSRWVPHCTLATGLGRQALSCAAAAELRRFEPVQAMVAALAVIHVGAVGDHAFMPLTGRARRP